MKIKYNFGLLKGLNVGFLYPSTGRGYHGQLSKVIKKGQYYRFIYDDCYIEISEIQFSSCKFELINDRIWLAGIFDQRKKWRWSGITCYPFPL